MQKSTIFALAALAICSLVLFGLNVQEDKSPERVAFEQFASEYSKSYESQEEREFRYQIFSNNLKMIQQHNAKYEQGLQSYEMGVNQFADVLHEEFSEMFQDSSEPTLNQGQCNGPPIPVNSTLEKNFTWVGKSNYFIYLDAFNEAVGEQGRCQSGYAFAAAGSAEASMYRTIGSFTPLSVQQLIDCSKDQGNQGCVKGSPANAFRYIMTRGFMTSSDYPYTSSGGNTGDCKYQSAKKMWELQNCTQSNNVSLNAVKSAIKIRPVAVSFDTSDSKFSHYKSGVFEGNSGCGNKINHYMLAVGWGFEKGTFLHNQKDYIILKNSFGPKWGDEGYIKVRYDDKHKQYSCGVNNEVHYPTG